MNCSIRVKKEHVIMTREEKMDIIRFCQENNVDPIEHIYKDNIYALQEEKEELLSLFYVLKAYETTLVQLCLPKDVVI
jgi:hypothetical protein